MKAAFYRQPGPPDVIEYGEIPPPKCGPHQILLRTSAVSVNPIDTYIRAGWIEHPAPRPTIVGCDASGIVAEVGSQVRDVRIGDRVWTTNMKANGPLLKSYSTYNKEFVHCKDLRIISVYI